MQVHWDAPTAASGCARCREGLCGLRKREFEGKRQGGGAHLAPALLGGFVLWGEGRDVCSDGEGLVGSGQAGARAAGSTPTRPARSPGPPNAPRGLRQALCLGVGELDAAQGRIPSPCCERTVSGAAGQGNGVVACDCCAFLGVIPVPCTVPHRFLLSQARGCDSD